MEYVLIGLFLLLTALGVPVYVPPEPQFIVSTGAALIAMDKHNAAG